MIINHVTNVVSEKNYCVSCEYKGSKHCKTCMSLAIHILTTKEKYIDVVFKKKHVRNLMALKIHAIFNTCYKLFINDSTEKKDTCFNNKNSAESRE